jgi:hypothetical protein
VRSVASFGQTLVPSCSRVSEFAQALERLDKTEKADREAVFTAARKWRINQYYSFSPTRVLRSSSLSDFRILERLADEGWGEEILSHRADYVWDIGKVKGVNVARPLTEKGTNAHILEKTCDLRTVSSVGGDRSPDTRRNAGVQREGRGRGSEIPLR